MDIDRFNQICNLFYDLEITLELNPEDDQEILVSSDAENMPLIIGKHGKNIKTLRELLHLYSKLHNIDYRLTIKEA